jgi:hypothetical protein
MIKCYGAIFLQVGILTTNSGKNVVGKCLFNSFPVIGSILVPTYLSGSCS